MVLEGKQIHSLNAFEHGFAAFSVKKGRKILYGIVHSDGRIRIEPIYSFAGIYSCNGEWFCQFGNFNSGWLVASLDDWNDTGRPREQLRSLDGKGKYFLIERKGGYKGAYKKSPEKILLQPIYRRLFFNADAFIVKNTKNKWGVLSLKGHEIIPFEYDMIFSYEDSYHVCKKISGKRKYGVMDKKGKLRIPLIYDAIYYINKKFITVANYDDQGNCIFWKLLDNEFNEIQSVFKELERFDYDDIYIYSTNPNLNILDVQVFSQYGGIIEVDDIEKTYHFKIALGNNHISSCHDGNFVVRRLDTFKYGLISSSGEGLVPCEYDYIDYGDNENFISVRKGDDCFCINSRNERVLF